ncbi:uncharacterized protein LOC117112836 isoform X2 [Anneissia japonica]|uniref:uncharacterized protein LOC117112836 isoform X2 n=1 Tax=Anneissia japonica TaxID=1529436 RepID=UPI001425A5FE|nr:uncharacterized protein LOC117112836 isoform X2 [Anneissia japonica]
MRYNIHLWSMVYILYVPTCVVGLVTEAVPGQNISLPCMVKQVNNQQIIKWWGHNGYISSGKMFTNILGATTPFYALPGAGNDYSLFIMIPDDIMIWTYLADTYECRLVLNNDDEDFQNLKIHELQIYQPECAIININGSTSVASCSYRNIQQFQETWLIVKDVSVACIRNCTSDICTLNYTYNPSEANPQDTVCNVTITGSMRTFKCTLKETHIPTLPPKTEASTALTSTTIQVQPHSTLNILKENTTTDIPDSDSNQKQGFITMVQFTIATACTSTVIFIVFIIEFYRCYKKRENNTNKHSTMLLQTMDVSNQLSGGTGFSYGNNVQQQSRIVIAPSINSQNVQNQLYQESNTAMQTFQEMEDNTALYHEVGEDSDATYQMDSSVNDVNYITCDQDNGGYLEVTA